MVGRLPGAPHVVELASGHLAPITHPEVVAELVVGATRA
jgi:hypothetical protein